MPHRFCPECGRALVPRGLGGGQRLACATCEYVYYNNSRPCVGVLALERGRVLLVERAIEPFKGYWDIPGGFLESGEHPEAGAAREMIEETGVAVELVELLGIFMDSYGPEHFPTLNICYIAKPVNGEPRAGSDAARVRWFSLDSLPDEIAFEWEREALELLQRRQE